MKHYANFFISGFILSVSASTFSLSKEDLESRVKYICKILAKNLPEFTANNGDKIEVLQSLMKANDRFEYRNYKDITDKKQIKEKLEGEVGEFIREYLSQNLDDSTMASEVSLLFSLLEDQPIQEPDSSSR